MLNPNMESRRYAGRTLVTIHRVNGETAEQDAYDARQTVRNHPDEWSFTPWPVNAQEEARKTVPLTDRRVAVPSETNGPYNV